MVRVEFTASMAEETKPKELEKNAEEEAELLPDMSIAQIRFQYSCDAEFCPDKEGLKAKLMEHVKKDSEFIMKHGELVAF